MKNNEKGISLVQVLIAIGLAGGLSLLLMRQQENANKVQGKMAFNQEINGLHYEIQTLMANHKNCSATVMNTVIPDNKDDDPNPVDGGIFKGGFDETTKVYTRLDGSKPELSADLVKSITGTDIGIDNIGIKRLSPTEVGLVVDFSPRGIRTPANSVLGGGTIRKTYRLQGEIDPATKMFENCYSAESELVDSLLANMPKCMITEASADPNIESCIGSYEKVDTYQQVVISEYKVTCSVKYRFTCGGLGGALVTDVRYCDCYTLNCTCSPPGKTCWADINGSQSCNDTSVSEMLTFNKCCQKADI